MSARRLVFLASLFVVVMMTVQPFTAAMGHSNNQSSGVITPQSSVSAPSNTSSTGNAISSTGPFSNYSGLSSYGGIPTRYVYEPNYHPDIMKKGNVYIPAYTASPAPMGVADYGVYNSSGTLTAESYSTTSFQGTLSVNNMTPLYVLNDAPQSLGIQLNAVLKGVNVGGTSSNEYWTQNVILYSARTHQIQFIDNVWNFSSPNATMNPGTLSSHGSNGTLVPNSLYYSTGPMVNVSYPFTVSLFLNSTVNGTSDQVYFNYSISENGKGAISGTYDYVKFNSSNPQSSPAEFYVSASKLSPIGIPYDAEFVIGGPGGGSTTSLFGMNATMTLEYKDSTTGLYSNVKSAYDAGSDTGETANGIAVSWNSKDQVTLTAGPSLIYGMWGISGSKMTSFNGGVSPSTSFMFVSNTSSFMNSTASWVPLSISGGYNFTLPSGAYSMAVMSSWHNPVYETLGSIPDLQLVKNSSMGIYTPLYIRGNSQAASMAQSGAGTLSSPYVISGQQNSTLQQVFGKFNDYGFPVFPGVLVSGVTDHMTLLSLPSFYIYYSQSQSKFLNFMGLPSFNYLNMEFYNDSNMTIANSSFISGWFPSTLAGYFPAANMILWNTTDSLISSNFFSGMDSSLLIYNSNGTDSNNTVWGNYFAQDTLASTSVYSSIDTIGAPTGLSLYSSDNLVYNNVFDIYNTAMSLNISIYSGNKMNYSNYWNISKESLSYQKVVLGYTLTGGILSSGPNSINYQGGNFWWNYLGNGTEVYNNSGLIYVGGDAVPLIHHVFRVTFHEVGLPQGIQWYVILGNGSIDIAGNSSSITFYEPNGTYYIELYSQGYIANQSSGLVIVTGADQSFNVSFARGYLLRFEEAGLPNNTQWSISVNGFTGYGSGGTIEFLATNGSYNYAVAGVQGFYPEASTGTFVITGSNLTVKISFIPFTFQGSFSETGLQSGTLWGVFINGHEFYSRTTSIGISLPNGSYDYSILGGKGYSVNNPFGTVTVSNGTFSSAIVFSAQNFTLTFTESGLASGSTWSVTIGGKRISSTNQSISMQESAGVYNFTVSSPSGYSSTPSSGKVDVNANVSMPISFAKTGSIGIYQAFDYGLFAASVIILIYSFFRLKKR